MSACYGKADHDSHQAIQERCEGGEVTHRRVHVAALVEVAAHPQEGVRPFPNQRLKQSLAVGEFCARLSLVSLRFGLPRSSSVGTTLKETVLGFY